MGYGAFYVICPRASSQSVTPLIAVSQDQISELIYINTKQELS